MYVETEPACGEDQCAFPLPAFCICVSSVPPAAVDEEPDEGDLEEHEEVSFCADSLLE